MMSQWKLIVTCLAIFFLTHCREDKYANFPVIKSYQNENHRYIFTNKGEGFFIGNSHSANRMAEEGWFVGDICYLKDYRVYINSHPVYRDSLLEFKYYPFSLIRTYSKKFQETFAVLDSINVLWWELEYSYPVKNLQFELLLNYDTEANPLVLSAENTQILLSPSVFSSIKSTDMPLWLGASIYWEKSNKINVICVLEKDSIAVKTAIDSYLSQRIHLKEKRIIRLKNFLETNQLDSNLPEVTDAVSWAQISLDALHSENSVFGIRAGIPQPYQYLARETFISFTSAWLIPGKFQEAKSILQWYATHQFADENNIFYGRIPLHLSGKNMCYKSADVTWWYIKALYEYLLYTDDLSFAEIIFPVIKKAISGALRYRVDQNFFIIHSNGETWMNEGNAPNRGNRAVEIQALWYDALQMGAQIARLTRNDNFSVHWLAIASTLRENFQKQFWNSYNYQIYDFLNPDGSHDKKVRPNQIFTVSTCKLPGINDLISLEAQAHITNTVVTKLTYHFGVSTLWQKDKDFLPCPNLNVSNGQKVSFYNGIVWNWLTGPVITSLLTLNHSDLAFELFFNQGKQILEGDVMANFGKWQRAARFKKRCDPQVSSSISHASTLAEFIGNFYLNFIGYQPMAPDSTIYLNPKLPEELSYLSAILPYKENKIHYEFIVDTEERNYTIVIARNWGDDPFKVKIQIPGFDPVQFFFNKEISTHSFQFNLDFRRSYKILPQLDWYFTLPDVQE